MMTDRQQMRAEARARRKAWRFDGDFPIRTELAALIDRAAVIGLYMPVGSETSVDTIVQHCRRRHKALALPWINGRTTAMRFRLWDAATPLEKGDFGFHQPLDTAPEVEPDTVLAPLLAFDTSLNRLGQGAGHYDRYFSKYPNVLRIGVAWSIQQIAAIPTEDWDIPLDGLATENGWIAGPRLKMADQ